MLRLRAQQRLRGVQGDAAEAVCGKRPFVTTQVKKDLKHFPAEVWNRNNKDAMMYCFFKRCYDDEEQFKQCLHFCETAF